MSYSEWVSAMKHLGPRPARIIENIESDRALPRPDRREFEARISRLWFDAGDTAGPVDILLTALVEPKPLDFRGPSADVGGETQLSTFLRESDTPRDWLMRSGVNEAHLLAFLESVLLRQVELDERYRVGDTPTSRKVWHTFASSVAECRERGDDMTRLRDRLGLSHVKPGDALLQVDCDVGNAGELHVATALDAGDNPSFLPSNEERPSTGMTRDLAAGGRPGLPEVISPPVPVRHLRLAGTTEEVQFHASQEF